MIYLTPDKAVKAREQLNLSQAKVALETGISRSYLSQFEGSKRLLEDHLLEALADFYKSRGWEPGADLDVQAPVEQHLKSVDHGLMIMDGFVIAQEACSDYVLEELLDEYYSNSKEIEQILLQDIKRGFLGGFLEDEALKAIIRPLTLMARQFQIKQILHGHLDGWPVYASLGVDTGSMSHVKSVGQYIQYLISEKLKDRVLPQGEVS